MWRRLRGKFCVPCFPFVHYPWQRSIVARPHERRRYYKEPLRRPEYGGSAIFNDYHFSEGHQSNDDLGLLGVIDVRFIDQCFHSRENDSCGNHDHHLQHLHEYEHEQEQHRKLLLPLDGTSTTTADSISHDGNHTNVNKVSTEQNVGHVKVNGYLKINAITAVDGNINVDHLQSTGGNSGSCTPCTEHSDLATCGVGSVHDDSTERLHSGVAVSTTSSHSDATELHIVEPITEVNTSSHHHLKSAAAAPNSTTTTMVVLQKELLTDFSEAPTSTSAVIGVGGEVSTTASSSSVYHHSFNHDQCSAAVCSETMATALFSSIEKGDSVPLLQSTTSLCVSCTTPVQTPVESTAESKTCYEHVVVGGEHQQQRPVAVDALWQGSSLLHVANGVKSAVILMPAEEVYNVHSDTRFVTAEDQRDACCSPSPTSDLQASSGVRSSTQPPQQHGDLHSSPGAAVDDHGSCISDTYTVVDPGFRPLTPPVNDQGTAVDCVGPVNDGECHNLAQQLEQSPTTKPFFAMQLNTPATTHATANTPHIAATTATTSNAGNTIPTSDTGNTTPTTVTTSGVASATSADNMKLENMSYPPFEHDGVRTTSTGNRSHSLPNVRCRRGLEFFNCLANNRKRNANNSNYGNTGTGRVRRHTTAEHLEHRFLRRKHLPRGGSRGTQNALRPKKGVRATHFVAIRASNQQLVEKAVNVQKRIVERAPHLAECCINPKKLHISLLVVSLSEEEVPIALGALAAGTCSTLEYMIFQ